MTSPPCSQPCAALWHPGSPLQGHNPLASRFPTDPLRFFIFLGVALALVVLTGCRPTQAQGGPPGPPPVSVVPAVQRTVSLIDEFTGLIEATHTVDIQARVGGTIEKVHFIEGQQVQQGQLLFSLDARGYQADLARAQAQLNAARASAKLANSEETRALKMLSEKAISQQEAEQLIAGTLSAQASVQAAAAAVQAAALQVEYSQIRSPITGVTSRAQATAGNLVAAGEGVLTTVVSQDKVYAYFDVPESIYLRYFQGNRVQPPSVHMGLSSEIDFPRAGAIDFFDNRLQPATASVRARAVFDNADHRLIPGLFARLRLSSGAIDAVMVPERSIGTDQSKRFVWVVGADQLPQFRQVSLGSLYQGMRVVTQGLKAGEHVVVGGLQRVRPGVALSPELLSIDAQGMPIDKPAPSSAKAS